MAARNLDVQLLDSNYFNARHLRILSRCAVLLLVCFLIAATLIDAGRDVQLRASAVTATGDTVVEAGRDIAITAGVDSTLHSVETRKKNAVTFKNHQEGFIEQEVAESTLASGGQLFLKANNTVRVTGSTVAAGDTLRVGKAQVITRDQDTGGLDASITIDGRMFSKEGWASITNDFKSAAEMVVNAPENIRSYAAQALIVASEELPLSPKQAANVVALSLTVAGVNQKNSSVYLDKYAYADLIKAGVSIEALNEALKSEKVVATLNTLGKIAEDAQQQGFGLNASDAPNSSAGHRPNEYVVDGRSTTITGTDNPPLPLALLWALADIGKVLQALPAKEREAAMLAMTVVTQGPLGAIKNELNGRLVNYVAGDHLAQLSSYAAAVVQSSARSGWSPDVIQSILSDPDGYISRADNPENAKRAVAELQYAQEGAQLGLELLSGLSSFGSKRNSSTGTSRVTTGHTEEHGGGSGGDTGGNGGIDGAGSTGTAGSSVKPESGGNQTAGATSNSAPVHHICTDKNCISDVRGGPWTPRFDAIFQKAGMDLNDELNKVAIPGHKGPHPEAYHQAVFDRLTSATNGLEGNAYKAALKIELQSIATELRTPGSLLNNLVTKP